MVPKKAATVLSFQGFFVKNEQLVQGLQAFEGAEVWIPPSG